MNTLIYPVMRNLNDCGCCEGVSIETPVEIANRSGLKAIAYRCGTYAQFKNSMLAHLSSSKFQALLNLSTREDDDFTIALLDAWATVSDVLTFYQERIANESYLRTATERMSLLNMARLIGYEFRPGVAASTYLAFKMEEAPKLPNPAIPGMPIPSLPTPIQVIPNIPKQTVIDIGTKVQSIPGPGEQAQIFETSEKIEARVELNAIIPRLMRPHPPDSTINSITLQGLATGLRIGDSILLVASNAPDKPTVNRVKNVVLDNNMKTTRIELEDGGAIPRYKPPCSEGEPPCKQGEMFKEPIALTDDVVKNKIIGNIKWKQDDLLALATIQKWSNETLEENINKQIARSPQQLEVFALRVRASLFGHNAPKWNSLPIGLTDGEWIVDKRKTDGTPINYKWKKPIYPKDWDNPPIDLGDYAKNNKIILDSTYPSIIKDNWLVLESQENQSNSRVVYRVVNNVNISYSDFGITSKVTCLELNKGDGFGDFKLRETIVLSQSEKLDLADNSIDLPLEGNNITLDHAYLNLKAGMKVILDGERIDMKGMKASEVMWIDSVTLEGGYTTIKFNDPLIYKYVRNTVSINANVALATHGETVNEILGSGDASQPYQRFTLKHLPLTYISAPTSGGAESTLEVWVNDIKWHEVPALYDHGSDERIYITRTDDDGKTTVQFGDRIIGARLPTGNDNIRATFRKGIGLGGMVWKEQLSLLMTRPLGVKEVINPFDASGAADHESLDDARLNAHLKILTIDRIVSLQDYENFARAFAGIAKANATWIWDGKKRTIFVTVAGPKGEKISHKSNLYTNLLGSIQKAGDPFVPLRVESYIPALFKLSASIGVEPDRRPEDVLGKIRGNLTNSFSFEARSFGQSVALSEIMSVIQSIPGVKAVDVDELKRTDNKGGDGTKQPLPAGLPQLGESEVNPAELLMLDLPSLNLKVRL